MNLKSRWITIASAVTVAGVVSAGAAMAATGSATLAPTAKAQVQTSRAQSEAEGLQAAVASGKLTQAEADVMKQLFDLRKAAMDQLKTDEKSVVDQAVTGGKLTQAQADKLLQPDCEGGPVLLSGVHAKVGYFYHMKFGDPAPDQVKAKPAQEQAFKAGTITWAEAGLQHAGKGGLERLPGDKANDACFSDIQFGEPTLDQVKAKLEQAVKDGTITQAQADKGLQQFIDHQKQEAGETNDSQATPTPAGN